MAAQGQNNDANFLSLDVEQINRIKRTLMDGFYQHQNMYRAGGGASTSGYLATFGATQNGTGNTNGGGWSGEKLTEELLQTLVQQQRKKLFVEGLFSDFTIVCVGKNEEQEEKFYVHRAILAARSEYFEKMLTSEGLKEARTGEMRIEDFGGEIIRLFLAFVYAGEKPTDYSLDEMKQLFQASDMYQVDELKTICEHKLAGMLCTGTALDLLIFAELYRDRAPTLKAAAIKFVNAQRAEIAKGENWMDFVRTQPDLMSELYLAPP